MSAYSVGQLIKDAVTGNVKISPQELADRRYAICTACPMYNKVLLICNDCGCFLPAKTKLKEATCPQNKW